MTSISLSLKHQENGGIEEIGLETPIPNVFLASVEWYHNINLQYLHLSICQWYSTNINFLSLAVIFSGGGIISGDNFDTYDSESDMFCYTYTSSFPTAFNCDSWYNVMDPPPPHTHTQMQMVSINWWQYAERVWSHANSTPPPNSHKASKLKINTANWNNSLHIGGTWYFPSDPYPSSVCARI